MYERLGRVTVYTGGLGVVYVIIEHVSILKGALRAFIVLWLLLVFSEMVGRHERGSALRWIGIILAVALLPWESFRLQTAAVMTAVGMAVADNATRTGAERLVRGLGVAVLLLGVSTVPAMTVVKETFLYAGAAFLVSYTVAEYAKSHEWGPKADASIIPAGVLGGLAGLYVDFSGRLMREYPSTAFYGRWLVLTCATIIVAAWAYSLIPGEHPEEINSRWDGPGMTSTWGEEAIRKFVLTGRKTDLISYMAYYGRDALSTREELKRALSKIEDYRETDVPRVMPRWLKKRYALKEVERRKKLVEEVLGEIDLMLKEGGG